MATHDRVIVGGYYLYKDHSQVIATLAETSGISESAAFRHLLALGLQQPMPALLPSEDQRRLRIGCTRNFAVEQSATQQLRRYTEQLKEQAGYRRLPRARVVRFLIEAGYEMLQIHCRPATATTP